MKFTITTKSFTECALVFTVITALLSGYVYFYAIDPVGTALLTKVLGLIIIVTFAIAQFIFIFFTGVSVGYKFYHYATTLYADLPAYKGLPMALRRALRPTTKA